ncbi:unnamed protein product [Echinostoma caproni]|uniref:RanBD1 domain-containing protein n=1 Tax=Echinostoma caproni TaxID=27848 RepID=A0A183ADD3_9TREM|nr:unnamed protein product [Echinostoma caproni]
MESQPKVSVEEKHNLPQPLNSTPTPTPPLVNLPTTNTVSSNFVFGQNISERVTNASVMPLSKETSTSSGTCGQDTGEDHEIVEITPCLTTLTDSANAVAAELREKSSPLSSEIPQEPIVTGEEGECTVLKTYCRFYDFDREKQLWVEKGNAYVHLNDIPLSKVGNDTSLTATVRPPTGPPARSRLVARVCKTLKLLANTPVWSGLTAAMADERSIRLTTICSAVGEEMPGAERQSLESQSKPEFRAYLLVMRSPNDATRLYQALLARKNITALTSASYGESADTGESNSDSSSAYGSNETGVCLVPESEAVEQGSA